MSISVNITVMFEKPFWIGLYERIDDNIYEVCKITFGEEPKDYEVHEFFLQHWHMLKFSPAIKSDNIQKNKINPKRMQRIINKQLEQKSMGTKAQQALKLQHELIKVKIKTTSREQREAEKQRKYELKQLKKKTKHRGH